MSPALPRVLVSAYACGPGEGSEPGSGWQLARAAAEHHEVWVVTRHRFRPSIDAALEADPGLASRLHVTYLDLPVPLLRLKRGSIGVYWYYVLWQRALAATARRLHDEVGFDVAHHATFASDWLPVGLTSLPASVPVVWGPVGGATYVPRPVRRWLGWRARPGERLRELLTRAARRAWGDAAARRADLVVAHNPDVAARFADRPVVVEPNPALDAAELVPGEHGADALDLPGTSGRRAVFVGRLVSWKGTRLALEAVAGEPDWSLTFLGEGPEAPYLRRRARRLGVQDRVLLQGAIPRGTVLATLAAADVLVLPSMHDSASWVTAEAVSLGTPVVCLDVGGPPVVMDGRGAAVRADEDVVEGLRAALRSSVPPSSASTRWLAERLPEVVCGWYQQVQGTRASEASPTAAR